MFFFFLVSLTLGCVPRDDIWESYTLHVLFQRNNPRSVAAKNSLKNEFCNVFGVYPCEVVNGNADELYIKNDFAVNIPRGNYFLWTISWFAQSGAPSRYHIDISINPNTECGSRIDYNRYSIYQGQPVPLDTNKFYIPTTRLPLFQEAASDNNSWAYDCSSDETCYKPYKKGTTCTGAFNKNIFFHLHLYWIQNSQSQVDAKDSFHSQTAVKFNISSTTCADTTGHEQNQGDEPCWLTGPSGVESDYPEDHAGSSFVIGSHSLYIPYSHFSEIIPWIMKYKNSESVGSDLSFLLHPAFGCNYADHQDWSFRGNSAWPNNAFGIAMSGGYTGSEAHSLDVNGAAYDLANAPSETCGDPLKTNSFHLHLLYELQNAESFEAKDLFVNTAEAWVPSIKVFENKFAYLNPGSPFTTSIVDIVFDRASFPLMLQLAMIFRKRDQNKLADLDVLLSLDTGCPYHDIVTKSMYGGHAWPFNTEFTKSSPPQMTRIQPTRRSPRRLERKVADINSFLLYVLSPPNLLWETEAKDILTSSLESEFQIGSCADSTPVIEPNLDGLCVFPEVKQPYKDASDPMTVTYTLYFVPGSNITDFMSYAMANRDALATGKYNVDLLLVPLTGTPELDYLDYALRAGSPMGLNDDVLKTRKPTTNTKKGF